MEIQRKLEILSAAAKFDVSCSSSGGNRNTPAGGMGNSEPTGICHSFTEDGRCVSLLKILLSNACLYDCAYCANRRSNDIPRATFKVQEVVNLTLEFYQRNYIEGLFLSSGVVKNPDYTMEALGRVAKSLREEHRFGGYIHLKAIPGASPELLHAAGLYADRMSVNIEIPSEPALKLLAPEKDFASVYQPMNAIHDKIVEYQAERHPRSLAIGNQVSGVIPESGDSCHPVPAQPSPLRSSLAVSRRRPPRYVPAGQSTQLIVGASPESDLHILRLASGLYQQQELKRVYYSGYIPINVDKRLPALLEPPLRRENRLYQSDWLMRFYHFRADEILDEQHPHLDPDFDPKMVWALRHPEVFPIDLDYADYEMILRVPGIGVRSAKMIVAGRRFGKIRREHLKKMGVALKRAQYFIVNPDVPRALQRMYPEQVRIALSPAAARPQQMNLFGEKSPRLIA
jgi:putative DNA modification/repair radical SAM protein